MSKTVDLFIASDQTIEAVAETLARVTGWLIEPGELPGTWCLRHGEQRADLHAHPYVNDGTLAFERYAFALTAQVTGSRLTESPEAAMLRVVADRLHEAGLTTMLVHDLQYREHSAGAAPQGDGPAAEAS